MWRGGQWPKEQIGARAKCGGGGSFQNCPPPAPFQEDVGRSIPEAGHAESSPEGWLLQMGDQASGWRYRTGLGVVGQVTQAGLTLEKPRFPSGGEGESYDLREVGSRLWFWLQDPFRQPKLTGTPTSQG